MSKNYIITIIIIIAVIIIGGLAIVQNTPDKEGTSDTTLPQ
jgi:uncharacterized protein YxeA